MDYHMNYKVLIVDDSKLARMAVRKVLSTLYPGWTGVDAGNSEEAIRSLKEAAPDIAVLDFNMPGRDGLELAAEFRRIRPTMPVAVISANRQQEVVNRAQAIGARFLAKPLTEQQLGDFLAVAERELKEAGS
jgi:DNA-binding NarL/FixJ family response regulator